MNFEEMLSGGDPRTLGQVDNVIKIILTDSRMLDDLFDCIKSSDEIVRMRASDALEKICKQKPDWLKPYKFTLLNDWPKIQQPSVQWHLAQILSEVSLDEDETKLAISILLNNFKITNDWIVTNLTLESLVTFTRRGSLNQEEFVEILNNQLNSNHKSVVSRVKKYLKEFDKNSL